MDFDRTAVRHRPAVFGDTAFAVFVRGDDGTVEHWWSNGDDRNLMFGPELLGGDFDTDPVVAFEQDGDVRRLHLIGRSGIKLVDWWWDDPDYTSWLGAPQQRLLPGWCATDPVVEVSSGWVNVFALGVEGVIRHWFRGPYGWFEAKTLPGRWAGSTPAVVSRGPGIFDVFATPRGGGDGLGHWWNADGDWCFEWRPGQSPTGPVVAASYARDRLDIFAVEAGMPLHWGWDGQWWDRDVALSTAHFPATDQIGCRDLAFVYHGGGGLSLVGSLEDDSVVIWDLQAPVGWEPMMMELGTSPYPFAVWQTGYGEIQVLSRNDDGTFTLHVLRRNDDPDQVGGPLAFTWGWDSVTLTLAGPEPPPRDLTPPTTDAQLLLTRAEDLVVVGVRWSGAEVSAAEPDGPALVAGDAARLFVFLPPQHIAEEVLRADEGMPPAAPTRRSALAGPSRVVVDLPEKTRLTAEGLLDALGRGHVVRSAGTADLATAIELPYGLVISPTTPDDAAISCAHPADAITSAAGSVGLWQTSIAVDGAPPGGPAGLTLRAIDATSTDPFPTALTGGSRTRIVLEAPTAKIGRLALSTLGGSLDAAGDWGTFAWEHSATLGRDRRVRTVTKGVLYPFGHAAEYVEVTERVFDGSHAGATAYLRKSTSLLVTEPMRAGDRVRSRGFPFPEVGIEQTHFEIAAADWQTHTLSTPEADYLQEAQAEEAQRRAQWYGWFYPTGEPYDGAPSMEEYAEKWWQYEDELVDAAHPEWGTKGAVAESYLRSFARSARIAAQLEALPHEGALDVPVFFVPRSPTGDAPPVRFPVRLRGTLGDVHVALPLVFVADVDKPHSLLHPGFSSLTDPEVARLVADAYRAVGDGDVAVDGVTIDLLCADESRDADAHEVTRLHIVGELRDDGFHPRLGVAPGPGEAEAPAADRWGFDVVLPEVRTLLGRDEAPLRLAYSLDQLGSEQAVDIPFRVPDGAATLVTGFAENSARSGGLVAPDFEADGISRTYGLVNTAGLLDRVGDHLDPTKLLDESATLLGFRLIDLIDAQSLDKPPAILRSADGSRVTLTWPTVKLATSAGPFITTDHSLLDLTVSIGTEQETTCTVQHVALALPDRDASVKLIEVSFEEIKFHQVGGSSPTLDISGLDTQFFGILKLLKDLQEAVDLGNAGPQIEPTPTGISASYTLPVPDVAAGYFRLTGLVFHAGIYVPFDQRPVALSLAFASREKPFNLSVLAFGGGGYVDVLIDNTGLRRLELALEFGASLAVDFVVASGEVHAMGGVLIVSDNGHWHLGGYIRFGGSVEILGLISASMELTVALTYDVDRNRMWGRATLVLEVDLTLWSTSVELDSGTWELIGGNGSPRPAREQLAAPAQLPNGARGLEDWVRYRAMFAGVR